MKFLFLAVALISPLAQAVVGDHHFIMAKCQVSRGAGDHLKITVYGDATFQCPERKKSYQARMILGEGDHSMLTDAIIRLKNKRLSITDKNMTIYFPLFKAGEGIAAKFTESATSHTEEESYSMTCDVPTWGDVYCGEPGPGSTHRK